MTGHNFILFYMSLVREYLGYIPNTNYPFMTRNRYVGNRGSIVHEIKEWRKFLRKSYLLHFCSNLQWSFPWALLKLTSKYLHFIYCIQNSAMFLQNKNEQKRKLLCRQWKHQGFTKALTRNKRKVNFSHQDTLIRLKTCEI